MSGDVLLIRPQTTPLRGSITVPGDKSISHRAVILAAVAGGQSIIRNWLPAGDTLATLGAVQALGVEVEIDVRTPQAWDLQIEGRGLGGLRPSPEPLDMRNAGTGMRLMAGLMAGQSFASVLDGSEQLRRRPMTRITEPLSSMGAAISSTDGRAPLHVQPAALNGIRYQMKVASAQVKSALILAGLYAEGATAVFQPGSARDHTERMLGAMGIEVREADQWITLPPSANGLRHLRPLELTVPGDLSSAAFPLVAAAIVPHSKITVRGAGVNHTRTGLLDILKAMGAQVELSNERTTGGEPVADLTVHFEELHSTEIGGDVVVRGIDEFPILTVAATQAAGVSTVRDAAELRVKEVDRIAVLGGELRKMGVELNERPDGYTVTGPVRLRGAEVDSHDDHRLSMALAVAGLVAAQATTVLDAACAHDSFPNFAGTMQALGANMEWV